MRSGALGDGPHQLEPLAAALDPAVRSEAAVVLTCQLLARQQVVEEQAAVIDHARDHLDLGGRGGIEAQLPGPGLERVEDDHRPVEQRAEPLQTADQVQREAVGGTRRDADQARQAGLAQRRHPLPHRLAVVADAVGVVEQQQIEAVDLAAL